MKCILHIGTEKTGTTSIQNFLLRNDSALSAHGIATSRALGLGNNRALPTYFHSAVDDFARWHRLRTRAEVQAYFRPALDGFRREVEEAGRTCSTVLISSEHCHSRLSTREEIAALRAFLEPLFSEIEVHVYFREQSQLVQSNYSTWIEGGGGAASLTEFSREAVPGNPYYDYLALSQMWTAEFGASNYYPKVFSRAALQNEDVRADFLFNVLKIEDSSNFDFSASNANQSLGAVQGNRV